MLSENFKNISKYFFNYSITVQRYRIERGPYKLDLNNFHKVYTIGIHAKK